MPAPPHTSRNHYIPAALVGEFSTSPVTPRRRSKVLTAFKGDDFHKARPMAAENIFLLREFYSLPEYDDEIRVGLLAKTWDSVLSLELPPAPEGADLEDILRTWAPFVGMDAPLRRDQTEVLLASQLDGPVDPLMNALRNGQDPDEQELELIKRFLAVALIRSPAWCESASGSFLENSLADSRRRLTSSAGGYSPKAFEHPVIKLQEEVLREAFYPLMIASYLDGKHPFTGFTTQLCLLEAPGPAGFIITDNAARPYRTTEDPRYLSRAMPVFKEKKTAMTFPIGPRHCLEIRRHIKGPKFKRVAVTDRRVRAINSSLLTLATRTVVYPEGNRDVFLPFVRPYFVKPWKEPKLEW